MVINLSLFALKVGYTRPKSNRVGRVCGIGDERRHDVRPDVRYRSLSSRCAFMPGCAWPDATVPSLSIHRVVRTLSARCALAKPGCARPDAFLFEARPRVGSRLERPRLGVYYTGDARSFGRVRMWSYISLSLSLILLVQLGATVNLMIMHAYFQMYECLTASWVWCGVTRNEYWCTSTRATSHF